MRGVETSVERVRMVLPLILAMSTAVAVLGAGQASGQTVAPVSQLESHAGHDSHSQTGQLDRDGMADLSADEFYFTVNVAMGDTGIQPAAVFMPVGRRVQLLLRTRGVSEHHYRVVGLVPDNLLWVAEPDSAMDEAAANADASDEHSNHHPPLAFVPWRAESPAGILPTGNEVHAYVSAGRGLDVVIFTPTNAGTFDVQCDLHNETVGKVTVFDTATPSVSPVAGLGSQALTGVLTRKLGSTGSAGAAGAEVEATYVPSEYASRILGPAGVAGLGPGPHVTMLVTELVHTVDLPAEVEPPAVYVSGDQLPLVDSRVIATSSHHRATVYRFTPGDGFEQQHQVMTLRLASGQEATWHLPIVVPDVVLSAGVPVGLGQNWGLILALLGGMVGAMWPCLFQLTVYFIPALAGIGMQDTGDVSNRGRQRQVLRAAFFFILGFTLVYTATGAVIGFAAQRFSDSSALDMWQRYFGIGAGIIVIVLALRVAVNARAPLVCKMPVLSWMARSNKKKTAHPMEMMLAGLAFATSCMTCFGSALVIVMVVYVGLAQSAFYGALVLFIFSLGMGIPLVIAAVAMAKALPFLLKLETAVPWMGLISAIIMVGFGVLLITGNYMVVSELTYGLANGAASFLEVGNGLLLVPAVATGLGLLGWLGWMVAHGKMRRPSGVNLGA